MRKKETMMRVKLDTYEEMKVEAAIRRTKSLSETLDELIRDSRRKKDNRGLYGMLSV